MSCYFQPSEIRPIISNGVILQTLIQDPIVNGCFYANQIEDELHSIIQMILTPCDTVFQKKALQGRMQTLNEWIKASSHPRSEEHTSELQSQFHLVCRLL